MSDRPLPLFESSNGSLFYNTSKKEIYFKDDLGYKILLGSLTRSTLGSKGETGPQGPPGEIGPVGKQGERGPQGIQGPRGERGPQGIQGIQGIPGPQGKRGDQGERGPRGDIGPRGDSGNNTSYLMNLVPKLNKLSQGNLYTLTPNRNIKLFDINFDKNEIILENGLFKITYHIYWESINKDPIYCFIYDDTVVPYSLKIDKTNQPINLSQHTIIYESITKKSISLNVFCNSEINILSKISFIEIIKIM
jgi:hypothetical protein